jgi:hypothetical protein
MRTDVALMAPEPVATEPLRLLITTSLAALNVVVALLMFPLERSSILPDVVCRLSLMLMGEVFVEEPIVIELGFWVNVCAEEKSNVVMLVTPFRSVVLNGSILIGPATLKSTAKLVPMRSA